MKQRGASRDDGVDVIGACKLAFVHPNPDLRRLAKPPGEAVLPALDALAVGLAVLPQEESSGGGKREEMVVQGRGQRLHLGWADAGGGDQGEKREDRRCSRHGDAIVPGRP